MNIFAKKILLNLIYSNKAKNQEECQRLVNISIDILAFYMSSNQGCRLLGGTETMQQLIQNGLNSF